MTPVLTGGGMPTPDELHAGTTLWYSDTVQSSGSVDRFAPRTMLNTQRSHCAFLLPVVTKPEAGKVRNMSKIYHSSRLEVRVL